jgi:hypothetical protein
MKKLSYFLLAAIITLSASCSDSKNSSSSESSKESPQLYIKTITVTGADDNSVRNEEISTITTDYFEVGLSTSTKSSGVTYIPEKKLIEPTSMEDFKMKWFEIVDKDGNPIIFNSTTEFLNFMSGMNYEMVDQKKLKYRTDYTFKKK